MAMVLKAGGPREFDQVMRLYHEAPSNVEKKQVRVFPCLANDPLTTAAAIQPPSSHLFCFALRCTTPSGRRRTRP